MEPHETVVTYIRWIPLLPLLGSLINGVVGKRMPKRAAGYLACGTLGFSLIIAFAGLLALAGLPPESRRLVDQVYTWILSGTGDWTLEADVRFAFDPLSAVMAMVVTGVGCLIHIYSLGYMGHDGRFQRYFSYLNLFAAFMLILVLADNILLMFVGWEGVGLCSYLLIGFWFERRSAADAGKKAFIVNRVGDFGFLVGIMLIFVTFRTLDFAALRESVEAHPELYSVGLMTAITLLLFIGATGKSAQIPLYTWLPDAMEGPTPVSALIHAATMVTAGVYMIARMNFFYLLAPTTMLLVAVLGAATAFFAASMGMAQTDIKRVLAYSTISQLGYMFLAVGVGAFSAGIFHLMTHAFFKALLFLGAGAVIHALADEMDMRRMGGLRARLPITFITMTIAVAAISGFPFLSGFFSKDEILWSAFSSPFGHPLFWVVGFLTAGVTAFYMVRLLFMTFFGTCRAAPEVQHHIHEAPANMTVPLIILAIFSVAGGFFGVPEALGGGNRFHHFLEPVLGSLHGAGEVAEHNPGPASAAPAAEYGLMLAAVGIAALGFFIAHTMYIRRPEAPALLAKRYPWQYRMLLNKYYVDEFYHAAVVRPVIRFSNLLWTFWDVLVIDGIVNGVGWIVQRVARGLRLVQTGYVQNYALLTVMGVVAIVVYLVTR